MSDSQILVPPSCTSRSAPILIVDGPEKSGKTTLVNSLREKYHVDSENLGDMARNGTFKGPDDLLRLAYYNLIDERPAIWDRSWVTNCLYGRLGHNPYGIQGLADEFESEWLLGRMLTRCGLGLILLGPDGKTLESLRTGDDCRADVDLERKVYADYGHEHGYLVVENQHTRIDGNLLTDTVWRLARLLDKERVSSPLASVGAQKSRVSFVESRVDGAYFTGFLPCSGEPFMTIARALGPLARDIVWARACSDAIDVVSKSDCIITRGLEAQNWAKSLPGDHHIVSIDWMDDHSDWARFEAHYRMNVFVNSIRSWLTHGTEIRRTS